MTDIQAEQAFALTAEVSAGEIDISQAVPLAVINYPSKDVEISLAQAQVVGDRTIEATVYQAFTMVVIRGLPEWPICRAWKYTLDGHDFYILNTVNETFVCDLSLDPPGWYVWGSGESDLWRGWIGNQWQASLPNEDGFGSNILVGDRANGTLYFLNPELPADDNADFAQQTTAPFKRVITGQIMVRGRNSISCPGVELTGSPPQLYDSTLNVAELFTSDDRGATYVSCGSITVEENAFDQRFDWLSLGGMENPGRLFRVVDYGALTRIDGLDMPDAPKS